MMYETVYVGIDIGTTSVKVSVVNNEGKELVSRTEDTNADIKNECSDERYEQCPLKIIKVVENVFNCAISDIAGSPTKIKGIGVSGQMHGLVLWKKVEGHQVTENKEKKEDLKRQLKCLLSIASESQPSHLFTWQDQRCSPAFLATIPAPSNSKLPISTGHGCATLFWLTRCSDDNTLEQGQYDCCGTIMDYLVYLLCGLEHPVTSDQLAASLGYFNKEMKEWDSVLSATSDFPNHLLPTIVTAGTRIGTVRPFLSTWPSEVPVLVGMGDVQCAMAAVIQHSNQAAVNISTSIQLGLPIPSVNIPTVEKNCPPSISFFPYFGHQHLALCAGLNGGNAVRHFVECVANWMRQLGFDEESCTITSVFSRLQKLAIDDTTHQQDNIRPSTHISPSLAVRPTFYGERHDSSLHGQISNITMTNFQNIGNLFRAVSEGIVSHLFDMVPSSFLQRLGVQELLVCGSVPEKNPLIKQALQHFYSEGGVLVTMGIPGGAKLMSSSAGAALMARNIFCST